MTGAILKPLRWTLLSIEDLINVEAAWSAGLDGLSGGYRHAPSCQFVFFEPGSIKEHGLIQARLAKIGKVFPTSEEASWAFNEISRQISRYQFETDGEIWHIRNRSPDVFSSRFEGRDTAFVFETGSGPLVKRVTGSKLSKTLDFVKVIAQGCPSEMIEQEASEAGLEAEEIFQDLLTRGALSMVEGRTHTGLGDLPEFLFLGHSSFAVRSDDTLALFDPVLLPGNSFADDMERSFSYLLRRADLIVISHHHWDHLHFQTLCRIPRKTRLIVPHVDRPTLANPPIAEYLRSLGFLNVEERHPGEIILINGIELRLFPFFGEPFGLSSHFAGFTYHVKFSGRTLYASVDTAFDEKGDMESTIADVARLGDLDFFLFGCSGQAHQVPLAAAGLRHFSNELSKAMEFIRYHPNMADAKRWTDVLAPRCLIPYAEFVFSGARRGDLHLNSLGTQGPETLREAIGFSKDSEKSAWLAEIEDWAKTATQPLVVLSPMQGIRF